MIYFILVSIILYLLFKEYRYYKSVSALLSVYLNLLKINYLKSKKKTIINLEIYENLIGNELSAGEYDSIFKELSKAWKIPYVKSKYGPFADGKKILEYLINKLDYVIKEPEFQEIIEKTENRIKYPSESDDL